MTRDEILNMKAGREMDALIDQKVFGNVKSNWDYEFTLPHYSTYIGSAWEVIQKMHSLGWASNIEFDIHTYSCEFSNVQGVLGNVRANGLSSAPLAICKAALLAVMK